MGIGAQQAAEQASEFRIAAAVDLLRMIERAPRLAAITLCYGRIGIVRRFVKIRDGKKSAIAEQVHQNFHPNGHHIPLR